MRRFYDTSGKKGVREFREKCQRLSRRCDEMNDDVELNVVETSCLLTLHHYVATVVDISTLRQGTLSAKKRGFYEKDYVSNVSSINYAKSFDIRRSIKEKKLIEDQKVLVGKVSYEI